MKLEMNSENAPNADSLNGTVFGFDSHTIDTSEGSSILSTLAPYQEYPSGAPIFKQGSPAAAIHFIGRGHVKLTRVNENGAELIVGLRCSGWLLGASSVILGRPYMLTAVTLTPCRVHRIQAETFRESLKRNARLSWDLHEALSRECLEHMVRVLQLGSLSARRCLESIFWQWISKVPSTAQKEIRLQLPLKHWELANLISVTPEYLSRILNRMEQEGIMRRDKGWLIIPDPQRLWHPADFDDFWSIHARP